MAAQKEHQEEKVKKEDFEKEKKKLKNWKTPNV